MYSVAYEMLVNSYCCYFFFSNSTFDSLDCQIVVFGELNILKFNQIWTFEWITLSVFERQPLAEF